VGWQYFWPASEPTQIARTVSEVAPQPVHATGFSIMPGGLDALASNPQSPQPNEINRLDVASNGAQEKTVLPTSQKNRSKEPGIYDREFARSAWTYNLQAPGYGALGVQRSIDKAVSQMERVADLLARHNIKLSVGVYPWPAQLKYDQEHSLQVQIWQRFCEHRCENFYNAFPAFFSTLRASGIQATIDRYYYPGDMHSEGANVYFNHSTESIRTPSLRPSPFMPMLRGIKQRSNLSSTRKSLPDKTPDGKNSSRS
jgi:hypothetical protein